MRYTITLVLTGLTLCTASAQKADTTGQEIFSSIPVQAALTRHILFVNVGGALADAEFADGAGKIKSLLPLNIWTNAISTSMIPALVTRPELLKKRFGEQVVLTVFVEHTARGPSFMQVPGVWSLINLRGLTKDQPDPEILQERIRKMFLKGLAHAVGIGSNIDPYCVMWCKSFTLQGMDKTSASFGPYAFPPMQEVLRDLAGPEIFQLPRITTE